MFYCLGLPLSLMCPPQVRCGRVPVAARHADPSLPSTEVWCPSRAVAVEQQGNVKVIAVEFVAVRDSKRHMHWVHLRAVSPAIRTIASLPGRITKDESGQFVPMASQTDLE